MQDITYDGLYGRVLRYFERVFVATLFSNVADIGSIYLFVASCQKLFVAGCQNDPFLDNKPMITRKQNFMRFTA